MSDNAFLLWVNFYSLWVNPYPYPEHVSRNMRYNSQSRDNNINFTFHLLNRYQQWHLRLFTILQEAGYNISVRKNLLVMKQYIPLMVDYKKNMLHWISLCYERNWVVGSIRKIDVSDCIQPTASPKSAMSTNNILKMRGIQQWQW